MPIRLGTPIVELHKRTTAGFGNAIMLATWGNGLGLIKKSLKQVVIGGPAVIRFEALNPCDATRDLL